MSADLIDEFLAYVRDLDDDEGYQLFHPAVIETMIRAIAHRNDFVITLDQLAEWLAVQVGHLKRFLVNYKEGIDYHLTLKPTTSPKGGRPKEIITLSMDCVKRLALRSRGKRAEQVRTYFIRTEEALPSWIELLEDHGSLVHDNC